MIERIRSYREFERRDNETPEETGRRWAREALSTLRQALLPPSVPEGDRHAG